MKSQTMLLLALAAAAAGAYFYTRPKPATAVKPDVPKPVSNPPPAKGDDGIFGTGISAADIRDGYATFTSLREAW